MIGTLPGVIRTLPGVARTRLGMIRTPAEITWSRVRATGSKLRESRSLVGTIRISARMTEQGIRVPPISPGDSEIGAEDREVGGDNSEIGADDLGLSADGSDPGVLGFAPFWETMQLCSNRLLRALRPESVSALPFEAR